MPIIDRIKYVTLSREWLKLNWQLLEDCGSDIKWNSWKETEYLQELPEKFSLSFAAFSLDKLVGFCIVSEKEGAAYLHFFMVRSDFRGTGKTKEIWTELCSRMKRKGYARLQWKVKENNIQAIKFYSKVNPIQISKEKEHLTFEIPLKRILSAHQPNFMPWYPFFQKIQQSDVCVLLAQSEFTKGAYLNRFHDDTKKWYTMSVVKKGNHVPISEKRYSNPYEDWNMIKRKLPNYEPVLKQFDDCVGFDLSQTNINIIKKICNILDIQTEIVLDCQREARSTDRLVEISKEHKADIYLSGPSGRNYLEINKFDKENIAVLFPEETTFKRPILDILKENFI